MIIDKFVLPSKKVLIIFFTIIFVGIQTGNACASFWQIESITNSSHDGNTFIVLDNSGSPHISYYGREKNTLMYIYFKNSSWDIQTVDGSGNI